MASGGIKQARVRVTVDRILSTNPLFNRRARGNNRDKIRQAYEPDDALTKAIAKVRALRGLPPLEKKPIATKPREIAAAGLVTQSQTSPPPVASRRASPSATTPLSPRVTPTAPVDLSTIVGVQDFRDPQKKAAFFAATREQQLTLLESLAKFYCSGLETIVNAIPGWTDLSVPEVQALYALLKPEAPATVRGAAATGPAKPTIDIRKEFPTIEALADKYDQFAALAPEKQDEVLRMLAIRENRPDTADVLFEAYCLNRNPHTYELFNLINRTRNITVPEALSSIRTIGDLEARTFTFSQGDVDAQIGALNRMTGEESISVQRIIEILAETLSFGSQQRVSDIIKPDVLKHFDIKLPK